MNYGEKINLKQWNFSKLQRFQHQEDASSIRLGLRGWKDDLLKGTVYDPKSTERDYLSQYAAQFDTVELSDTFHEMPNPYEMERLKRKVEKVNANFRFCPLIPRLMSHETNLDLTTKHLDQFLYSLEALGSHLGATILQMPEAFGLRDLQRLKAFLSRWPKELQLLIDFRHQEWSRQRSSFKDLFRENIGLLITDDVGREEESERFVTGESLGVRFIGRSKLEGDDQRLALWVYRMNEFGAMGIKDSYFFLSEQPEMCLSILHMVSNSIGGRTRVPRSFDYESDQLSLF